jgi:hypothetical protein
MGNGIIQGVGMPWGLLRNTMTRRRFAALAANQGLYGQILPSEPLSTQTIKARISQHVSRLVEHGAEKDLPEGFSTFKIFIFNCNFYTDETLQEATDIIPSTDQLVFTMLGKTFECRVTDDYDAADQQHHIRGTAMWLGPTGY